MLRDRRLAELLRGRSAVQRPDHADKGAAIMCLTWTDRQKNRSMPGAAVIPQRLRELALLRRVRDRIDREYAQPLDVEALARGVNMPSGHLSREFRRAYGESPYSYVVARRIERAGEGTPLCGADPVTTPIRNREAPLTEPQLA